MQFDLRRVRQNLRLWRRQLVLEGMEVWKGTDRVSQFRVHALDRSGGEGRRSAQISVYLWAQNGRLPSHGTYVFRNIAVL